MGVFKRSVRCKNDFKTVMKVRLDNIKLHIGESEDKLISIAKRKLNGKLRHFEILKKSLDARDKNNIFWIYSIACSD